MISNWLCVNDDWKGEWTGPLKIKRLLFILTAALMIILYYDPPLLAAPKFQFSIIYTNDVMGEVEPCG